MTEKVEVTAEKNLRGVNCPMNLVYTKVAMAELKSGEVLEIILDDGPPINNVPGSVEKEGHQLLGKKQLADGAWSLLVRKK
ncbi:MAG: sulfurtransferase TusA family protein [Desulfurivibrio sp.]|nr:sulfurtransferase TusA family protein [Desulfurivibrio sp.]